MKAWTIPKHGPLHILTQATQPKPSCGKDEVLVRVHAAALNPADLKLVSGKDGGNLLHAQKFPMTPGFDFSGTIEETGEYVRDLKLDQDVFGFLPYARTTTQGSLSAYLSVKPDQVAPKPANVSHEAAAAAATTGCTALQGLRDKGQLREGQHVLVNGASGGVGSFAVQIARHAGATVHGTCSKKNMAMVKALGATAVFDYKETPVATFKQQFDIIFDAASNLSYHQCISLLKRGGVYITLLPSVSLATGIVRSLFSSKASRFVIVAPKSEDLAQLAAWLAGDAITSCIDTIYPFDQASDAFTHLERGPAGKIVVTI